MKQKQLNNQIHYINLLYICKQQMTSGTGNRNNIEIFLYSWWALLQSIKVKITDMFRRPRHWSVPKLYQKVSTGVLKMWAFEWSVLACCEWKTGLLTLWLGGATVLWIWWIQS